jgi:hypothetical protein
MEVIILPSITQCQLWELHSILAETLKLSFVVKAGGT